LTFLTRFVGSGTPLQALDELTSRDAARNAEIERFEEIYTPLANFGFRDEGLRFAKLLSQCRLVESGFFPDLTQ
jgi:hypothetical protein